MLIERRPLEEINEYIDKKLKEKEEYKNNNNPSPFKPASSIIVKEPSQTPTQLEDKGEDKPQDKGEDKPQEKGEEAQEKEKIVKKETAEKKEEEEKKTKE